MKQLLYLVTFFFFVNAASVSAQMSVSNPPTPPDPSAMMDIKSANKGLLIPRVANTSVIANPAQTLMVWSIFDNAYMYYQGNTWRKILDATTFNTQISLLNTRIDSARIAAVKISNDNDLLQDAAINTLNTGLVQTTNLTNANTTNITTINSALQTTNSNVSAVQTQVANTWSLNGNAAMATSFIGTTNSLPLVLKTNGKRVAMFSTLASSFGNLSIGENALKNDTGNGGAFTGNTAIGVESISNDVSGANNTGVGVYALTNNTSGNDNTATGGFALYNYKGNAPTMIFGGNTATGFASLYTIKEGQYNTSIGHRAGSGDNTITTLNYSTFIGAGSGATTNNLTNALAIGAGAGVGCSNCGNINVQKLGIGVSNPTETLEVPGKTKTQDLQVTTGAAVGKILTSDASGNATWQSPAAPNAWGLNGNASTTAGVNFIGTTDNQPLEFRVNNERVGSLTGVGKYNIAFGKDALISNGGIQNVAIGLNSLKNNTGLQNTAVGTYTLANNTSGYLNAAFGHGAIQQANGIENTAFGSYTFGDLINGNKNTALGAYSGGNVTNSYSGTFIGHGAGVTVNGTAKSLAIGADAKVDCSNCGNINVQKLGIGVSNPTETLEVPGKTKTQDLQVTTGAAVGKILTSDASGNATWQSPAAPNAWGLNGNASTTAGVNFIGTTDNQPLEFRVNNERVVMIPSANNGNIGLGRYTLKNETGTGFGAGIDNLAIGSWCLENNKGSKNTGLGVAALKENITGWANTAVGYNTLRYCQTNGNTANGVGALEFYDEPQGFGTIYEGQNSAFGFRSLEALKNGKNNTAIGANSGTIDASITTLNNCTFVNGVATANNLTNATAIAGSVGTSNSLVLGNQQIATTTIYGQQQTGSDIRLKDKIAANPYGLNLIKQIPTYTYEYKTVPGRTRIGIMAQDLVGLERKMGVKFPFLETPTDLENGRYAVSYTELITPLIEATKDLSKLNDAQQVKIDDLQNQLDKQARDIEELKAMMIVLSKK